MDTRLKGIHHITLCPGGAQEDVDFFTKVLGQRLVKQTVLMDGSIPIYHFYYGNADADPGSICTCFPYSRRPGRRGTGQIGGHQLLGAASARRRSGRTTSIATGRAQRHPGALRRAFDSRHAIRPASQLEVVENARRHPPAVDDAPRSRPTWRFAASSAPSCRCATSRSRRRSSSHALGFRKVGRRGRLSPLRDSRRRPGSHHRAAARARPAAGQLDLRRRHGPSHRASTSRPTRRWSQQKALYEELGYTDTSEVKDRFYFHSMYVRSPGGVLVECTANVPGGFYVDEPPEELGTHLNLPPWYEDQRDVILSQLEPVVVPEANRPKAGRVAPEARRPVPPPRQPHRAVAHQGRVLQSALSRRSRALPTRSGEPDVLDTLAARRIPTAHSA